MNVAAHQEKEKNKKTRKGRRKVAEEKRQATDFVEATYCLSVVVQRAAQRKNGLCEGVPGVTGTLGEVNSHFDPTQTELGTAPLR